MKHALAVFGDRRNCLLEDADTIDELILGHLSRETWQKGISAMQLAKKIGICYQTAWLVQHNIRKAMANRKCSHTLGSIVEVDGDYVSGVEEGGNRGRCGEVEAVVAVAVEHRA